MINATRNSQEHYMLPILRIHQEMESLQEKDSALCDREIKSSMHQIIELDRQKIHQLERESKNIQSKKAWSVLQNAAQYIATSSSVFLGASLIGAAPVTATIMIAAGGLGLINRAVSDSGGWKWVASKMTQDSDLQHRIAINIDNALTALSAIAAITSTIHAYRLGSLALSESARQKILQVVSVAAPVFQIITRFGIAHLNQKTWVFRSEMKKLDIACAAEREQIHAQTANLQRLVECSKRMGDIMKEALASI